LKPLVKWANVDVVLCIGYPEQLIIY